MAHRAAVAVLFAISIVWGATFVVVRDGLASVSPEVLIAVRFALASVILLIPALYLRQIDRATMRAGIILGVFLFFGYWLQTRGLLTTTPLRSAFLTTLTVVVVPFLEVVFYGARFGTITILASLLALGGALVMVGGLEARIVTGDVLTVLCAISFAAYVVLAARWSRSARPIGLAAVQLVVVTLLSFPLALVVDTGPFDRAAIVAILVTAVFATSAAFFLLMWAQAHTTAIETAIILAFEPVAAAAASLMTASEPVTAYAIAGGLMIFAATILCQIPGARVDGCTGAREDSRSS